MDESVESKPKLCTCSDDSKSNISEDVNKTEASIRNRKRSVEANVNSGPVVTNSKNEVIRTLKAATVNVGDAIKTETVKTNGSNNAVKTEAATNDTVCSNVSKMEMMKKRVKLECNCDIDESDSASGRAACNYCKTQARSIPENVAEPCEKVQRLADHLVSLRDHSCLSYSQAARVVDLYDDLNQSDKGRLPRPAKETATHRHAMSRVSEAVISRLLDIFPSTTTTTTTSTTTTTTTFTTTTSTTTTTTTTKLRERMDRLAMVENTFNKIGQLLAENGVTKDNPALQLPVVDGAMLRDWFEKREAEQENDAMTQQTRMPATSSAYSVALPPSSQLLSVVRDAYDDNELPSAFDEEHEENCSALGRQEEITVTLLPLDQKALVDRRQENVSVIGLSGDAIALQLANQTPSLSDARYQDSSFELRLLGGDTIARLPASLPSNSSRGDHEENYCELSCPESSTVTLLLANQTASSLEEEERCVENYSVIGGGCQETGTTFLQASQLFTSSDDRHLENYSVTGLLEETITSQPHDQTPASSDDGVVRDNHGPQPTSTASITATTTTAAATVTTTAEKSKAWRNCQRQISLDFQSLPKRSTTSYIPLLYLPPPQEGSVPTIVPLLHPDIHCRFQPPPPPPASTLTTRPQETAPGPTASVPTPSEDDHTTASQLVPKSTRRRRRKQREFAKLKKSGKPSPRLETSQKKTPYTAKRTEENSTENSPLLDTSQKSTGLPTATRAEENSSEPTPRLETTKKTTLYTAKQPKGKSGEPSPCLEASQKKTPPTSKPVSQHSQNSQAGSTPLIVTLPSDTQRQLQPSPPPPTENLSTLPQETVFDFGPSFPKRLRSEQPASNSTASSPTKERFSQPSQDSLPESLAVEVSSGATRGSESGPAAVRNGSSPSVVLSAESASKVRSSFRKIAPSPWQCVPAPPRFTQVPPPQRIVYVRRQSAPWPLEGGTTTSRIVHVTTVSQFTPRPPDVQCRLRPPPTATLSTLSSETAPRLRYVHAPLESGVTTSQIFYDTTVPQFAPSPKLPNIQCQLQPLPPPPPTTTLSPETAPGLRYVPTPLEGDHPSATIGRSTWWRWRKKMKLALQKGLPMPVFRKIYDVTCKHCQRRRDVSTHRQYYGVWWCQATAQLPFHEWMRLQKLSRSVKKKSAVPSPKP